MNDHQHKFVSNTDQKSSASSVEVLFLETLQRMVNCILGIHHFLQFKGKVLKPDRWMENSIN